MLGVVLDPLLPTHEAPKLPSSFTCVLFRDHGHSGDTQKHQRAAGTQAVAAAWNVVHARHDVTPARE